MMWHSDLNSISRCNGEQFSDLLGRWRQGGRRTFGQRHTDLHKHLLQASGSNRDQHLGRPIRFVLKRVRRPDRHIGKHSCCRHDLLAVNRERDLAFEEIDAFFPAVDIGRRSTARRYNCLPHRVFAVGVIADGQETIELLMLNKDYMVVSIQRNVPPWRAVICQVETVAVLETNVNELDILPGVGLDLRSVR